MDKGFIEDGFIVNLSNASNAAEVIYELSSILDMPEAQHKKICLKLEGIDLTQSQLLSIRALIESMDSTLEFVDTSSESTIEAAKGLDIQISELKNGITDFEYSLALNEVPLINSANSYNDFSFVLPV